MLLFLTNDFQFGNQFLVLRSASSAFQFDKLFQLHTTQRQSVNILDLRKRKQLLVSSSTGHFPQKIDRAEISDERKVKTVADRSSIELERQPGRYPRLPGVRKFHENWRLVFLSFAASRFRTSTPAFLVKFSHRNEILQTFGGRLAQLRADEAAVHIFHV
jgi:hypothetical protein